jgi:hypothetical protein
MAKPYTVTLSPAETKQLAELTLLVTSSGMHVRDISEAAFDKGVGFLLEALEAGHAVMFPAGATGAPIDIKHHPMREFQVKELLATVAKGQKVAPGDDVLAEAFRRGLDALTTIYVAMVAKKGVAPPQTPVPTPTPEEDTGQ